MRALKALVKLQALVKGHIVRKQTADMLRRMQTLVRLQARARASRSSHVPPSPHSLHARCVSEAEYSKVIAMDHHRSLWNAPQYSEDNDKILEVDTWKPHFASYYHKESSPSKRGSLPTSPQVRSRPGSSSGGGSRRSRRPGARRAAPAWTGPRFGHTRSSPGPVSRRRGGRSTPRGAAAGAACSCR